MATEPVARTSVDESDVRVRKRAVPRDDSVLQLWFKIRSMAPAPVAVRIVDDLPGGVAASDVGFHSGYAGEDWTCLGGRLWFTTTIQPDERVETVYAVRGVDERLAESLATPPTIEMVQALD